MNNLKIYLFIFIFHSEIEKYDKTNLIMLNRFEIESIIDLCTGDISKRPCCDDILNCFNNMIIANTDCPTRNYIAL